MDSKTYRWDSRAGKTAILRVRNVSAKNPAAADDGASFTQHRRRATKFAAACILRPLKARGKRSKEPAGNSSKSVGPLADGWSRAPKPSTQPFFPRRCARGKREQSWWLKPTTSPIHDLRARKSFVSPCAPAHG